jgi:hypothetical protein
MAREKWTMIKKGQRNIVFKYDRDVHFTINDSAEETIHLSRNYQRRYSKVP